MGQESPKRESRESRLQADREWSDAKCIDRRQVRLPGQGRGDVVRDRRQVRYMEIRPENSAGG